MSALADIQKKTLYQLKQKVLEEHYHDLCQCLDPVNHFSYLRSKGVLTRDEQEQIENVRRSENTSASSRKFVDIISTKLSGFDELCNSLLEDRTQVFLVETLNKALEQKLADYKLSHRPVILENQPDLSSLPLPPDISDEVTSSTDAAEVNSLSSILRSSGVSENSVTSTDRTNCHSSTFA